MLFQIAFLLNAGWSCFLKYIIFFLLWNFFITFLCWYVFKIKRKKSEFLRKKILERGPDNWKLELRDRTFSFRRVGEACSLLHCDWWLTSRASQLLTSSLKLPTSRTQVGKSAERTWPLASYWQVPRRSHRHVTSGSSKLARASLKETSRHSPEQKREKLLNRTPKDCFSLYSWFVQFFFMYYCNSGRST